MTKKLSSNAVTFILLGLAAVLLLFSTIVGARAALSEAATLKLRMMTKSLEIEITENGSTKVDDGGTLLGDVENGLVPGKKYEETLTIKNTGKIAAYVRVTFYRYWLSDDGKDVSLNPGYIKVLPGDSDWVLDESCSTEERLVYYYAKPLEPGESTSSPISAVMIDGKIMNEAYVVPTDDPSILTVVNDYDGLQIGFEAEVDSVQARNGADAILHEWGANVSVAGDGTLSF